MSRVFRRWSLIQNYKRCERFVSVNWEFPQFSTSSPANSLSVHGTILRQNKSTLGPEKPCLGLFEVSLLSELVFTYGKLNIYAKKISCHKHFRDLDFVSVHWNVTKRTRPHLVNYAYLSSTIFKACLRISFSVWHPLSLSSYLLYLDNFLTSGKLQRTKITELYDVALAVSLKLKEVDTTIWVPLFWRLPFFLCVSLISAGVKKLSHPLK